MKRTARIIGWCVAAGATVCIANAHTDPKLLDVAGALESLPRLIGAAESARTADSR